MVRLTDSRSRHGVGRSCVLSIFLPLIWDTNGRSRSTLISNTPMRCTAFYLRVGRRSRSAPEAAIPRSRLTAGASPPPVYATLGPSILSHPSSTIRPCRCHPGAVPLTPAGCIKKTDSHHQASRSIIKFGRPMTTSSLFACKMGDRDKTSSMTIC